MRGHWLFIIAVFNSCVPDRVGQECDVLEDCADGQECVIVNSAEAVCLPTPQRREPQSCTALTECTDSDIAWPVDVTCLNGFCRCPTGPGSCVGERGQVFEEESCSCVPIGGAGAACVTSFTCDLGFACDQTTQQCVPGAGLGTACRDSLDCDEGVCERRHPVALLGVCVSE